MLSKLSSSLMAAVAAALIAVAAAPGARAADYVPGEVVLGFAGPETLATAAATAVGATTLNVGPSPGVAGPGPGAELLSLPRGLSVKAAIARLKQRPGITYAVPNYRAHVAGDWIPNDPGNSKTPGGWERLQWNFLSPDGVNAPEAWSNLIADKRPGGRGVVVAILDTGVAYRNWRKFKRSPDFQGTRFVHPYDFISRGSYPVDRYGHGTFVAGTIAESTNNGLGVTGLAYEASIMPIRVLDSQGVGDSTTIAEGIRYAVNHGAQVINLSLEFDWGTTAGDIPDVMSALRFAHRRGVVVVAASGNEGEEQLAYPARAPAVIAVGATTRDRCLADYSNGGPGLDLVAPGGGDDATWLNDPDCHPDRNLPDIYQMTFFDPSHPDHFGLPGGWDGTSMASAHVAGAAALLIASGVLGRHPSPSQILSRLEHTATPLDGSAPNPSYGYGLLNVGAATSPLTG